MKLPAFLLGAACAGLVHGQFAAAVVLYLVAVLVLANRIPPSRCNQGCNQGRGCTCGKAAEDFA